MDKKKRDPNKISVLWKPNQNQKESIAMTNEIEMIIQNNIDHASSIDSNLESLPTKSAKIRYLFESGMTKSEISKKLDIRYQHVRNVLLTPLKK